MTKQTLNLLNMALMVRGDNNKKKTLPYLKKGLEELQEEVRRLENIQEVQHANA